MSDCLGEIVGRKRTAVRFWAVVLMVACTGLDCWADELPKDLVAIGGRWFVGPGATPIYYYKDGDRYVDLFSYHTKDSNKDGIDNVRLRHDSQFLIMESQGYPNHPTAVFPNSGNPNTIRVQNFTFRLPLVPKLADKITRLPMGPIGTGWLCWRGGGIEQPWVARWPNRRALRQYPTRRKPNG